jgi:hypothetical protein
MKKTILILFVLAAVTGGCKKIPFDKRNKYLGDYHFTNSYFTWNITPYQSPTTTAEYDGKVSYDKKSNKNVIDIEFAPSLVYRFEINDNGEITICGGGGKFENKNKVTFDYSSHSCPGNGLGGGIVYSVTGDKK